MHSDVLVYEKHSVISAGEKVFNNFANLEEENVADVLTNASLTLKRFVFTQRHMSGVINIPLLIKISCS